MCGIIGIVGQTSTALSPSAVVLEGLKRLEYRGYDSAGVAATSARGIEIRRAPGKVSALEALMQQNPFQGTINAAMGHTRWATHGEPTERNAHPHVVGHVAVVHNGIIENHQELRQQLQAQGVVFQSETDTEVIPALINHFYQAKQDATGAVQQALAQLKGAFALGVMFTDAPEVLYAARRGSPLLIGFGPQCHYLASDALALAPFTQEVLYLEPDDLALLTPTDVTVWNGHGQTVQRARHQVSPQALNTDKHGFDSFMRKEIAEQPTVVARTLQQYLKPGQNRVTLPALPFDLAAVDHIRMIACGTSYHAALVAKYWFEFFAQVPVSVDIASEFRYRQPPFTPGGLSVFISQSGETADTMAALELAKQARQHILSIVNVPQSSLDRASDVSLYTQAGPEIGVASTKAFTCQLTVLAALAMALAEAKNLSTDKARRERPSQLLALPHQLEQMLEFDAHMAQVAQAVAPAQSCLFLGRGVLFPVALEGALKLKEISYIHAEGLAAGELKHGSIALIDEHLPVVALAPMNPLFDKTLSNLQEVHARRGQVYVLTDAAGAAAIGSSLPHVMTLPTVPAFTQPLVYTVPLQLLAYHVAKLKGCDVDKPRNLAKSVTVE